MNRIELLAPAGNLEKAKTAIRYGADAVYVGGQSFSLRSRASNFSLEQIRELCIFAHEHGARVHVTVNIIPHQSDLEGLDAWLLALDDAGIDAIIAASPYILKRAVELHVSYEKHVSTQHSSVNSRTAAYWASHHMDRVVAGRECTLQDLRTLAHLSPIPVEAFIHGGMCISFSGRCVLSNHLTDRDANRGGCAQSCRWKYHLYDEKGAELSVPDRLFSMSSKDLRGLRQVPALMEAGIASLKIEGRMKSAYYLATVVSVYRRLIDMVYEGRQITEEMWQQLEGELLKAENRPAGPGFLEGAPDADMQLYRDSAEIITNEFVGYIMGEATDKGVPVQVRNRMELGQQFEVFGPHVNPQPVIISAFTDEEGNALTVCNKPMQVVYVNLQGPAPVHGMIRKVITSRRPE